MPARYRFFLALVAFVALTGRAVATTPTAATTTLSRLERHPARLALLVERAVKRLIANPVEMLSLGFAPAPGKPELNKKALRWAFAEATLKSVHFSGFTPEGMTEGRLGAIAAEVEGVKVYPLRARRVRLTLTEPRFDVNRLVEDGRLSFTDCKGFRYVAELAEEDLNLLIPSNYTLHIAGGRLMIQGRVRLLWISTLVRLEGVIVAEGGRRLVLRARHLNVGNLPFVQLFKDRVTRRFNPLIDLDKYLGRAKSVVQVTIDKVHLPDGAVVAEGGGVLAMARVGSISHSMQR